MLNTRFWKTKKAIEIQKENRLIDSNEKNSDDHPTDHISVWL